VPLFAVRSAWPARLTFTRYTSLPLTTSVAVINSPGVRSSTGVRSRTLKGIVIPGMNPRMSSCLTVISCRDGLTATICPRSS
jgi:hypothetical protein